MRQSTLTHGSHGQLYLANCLSNPNGCADPISAQYILDNLASNSYVNEDFYRRASQHMVGTVYPAYKSNVYDPSAVTPGNYWTDSRTGYGGTNIKERKSKTKKQRRKSKRIAKSRKSRRIVKSRITKSRKSRRIVKSRITKSRKSRRTSKN